MKPIFQSIICRERGDCFSACLASLLELPLDQVPSFNAMAIDSGAQCPQLDAINRIHEWVNGRGYTLLILQDRAVTDYRGILGQYVVMTMPSLQFGAGVYHAVVGQYQEHPASKLAVRLVVVHDPNPNNQPYPDNMVPVFVKFLVQKNPAIKRDYL